VRLDNEVIGSKRSGAWKSLTAEMVGQVAAFYPGTVVTCCCHSVIRLAR